MDLENHDEAEKPAGTTESLLSGAASCWADLEPAERDNLIGELLGAEHHRNVWLVWTIKKADGSVIGKRHIGQLGSMSMEDAEAWLASAKKSKAEWTRRGVDLDWLLRDEITLFEQRWHLRYSETPGGGWCVIEAMIKAGFAVQISGNDARWKVTVMKGAEAICMRAPTMEDAACQVALLVLPNATSAATGSERNAHE
jgi:hypothetical protein